MLPRQGALRARNRASYRVERSDWSHYPKVAELPAMTVSLSISKSKTAYLFAALVACLMFATYAAQREVMYDTENYYQFYRDLIEHGFTDILSCQSFEPLFCGGSYAFAKLTGSAPAVHFIWAFLFYAITLRAFLELWPHFVSQNKYTVISLITFFFAAINFVDAQQVYFLTRQYVASSLLMLGAAHCANKKSPLLAFAFASLIHFGAAPIAALLFFATRRRINLKFVAIGLGVLVVFAYFSSNYIVDLYLASVRYRINEYANRNDGNVTIVQEIRLILYWSAALYMFKIAKSKLLRAYILIYAFYLISFQNDLAHLRYYKYLESMAWPSSFILFYIKKEASPYVMVSALSYRLYSYAALLSPQSSLVYMARIIFVSLPSLLSRLPW